jgi:hypothetical protein
MEIYATNESKPRELIPAGNYMARCYQMLELGTTTETIEGKTVRLKKIRIGWELPTELKVFKEGEEAKPYSISEEYTLSMNEKATLRKMLASWRGKDFTEEEARKFAVTKLLGVPCQLNIIHKPSKKDPSRVYEKIATVSPLMKGVQCPEQVNKTTVLSYSDFDHSLFESLPDFIKDKIKSSEEYKAMAPSNTPAESSQAPNESDDLPF